MNYVPAKYTEVLVNLLNDERVKPLIDKALSTYPMYVSKSDHTYIPNVIPTREELNQAILNHYKYREIGFETIGRFLDELEIAMNEIMPYYNQLMFTQDQDYNIIYNVDYVRDTTRNLESETEGKAKTNATSTDTSESSSETSGTSENYGKNVTSDTPQNSLKITNKNINDVDYASEVSWSNDSGTTTAKSSGETSGTGTTNSTSESTGERLDNENIKEVTKGNYGQVSAQSLVLHYRETILNICQEIIRNERIRELFMTVY